MALGSADSGSGRGFTARRRVVRVTVFSLLACGVAGCPDGRKPICYEEPLPIGAVVARVNANSNRMDFLLRAVGGSAVGKWQRSPDSSATTSFDMKAHLLYRKPRDLYLRMEHTLSARIEAGSNSSEFWVWERLNDNRYYWGEHKWLDSSREADLPVRPDVLLDVLGVGDLPAHTTGIRGPVLWVRDECYQLVFLSYDDEGQGYISKVMEIGRGEPYLVDRILYFNPDGRPIMEVLLSEYKPIDGSEVLAPRKIDMKSLENENHMTLRFPKMERSDPPSAELNPFISPMRSGNVSYRDARRIDGWRPSPRPVMPPAPPTVPAAGTAPSPSPEASRPSEPATQPDAMVR